MSGRHRPRHRDRKRKATAPPAPAPAPTTAAVPAPAADETRTLVWGKDVATQMRVRISKGESEACDPQRVVASLIGYDRIGMVRAGIRWMAPFPAVTPGEISLLVLYTNEGMDRLFGKDVRGCESCGRVALGMSECSCFGAYYCGKACRDDDWPRHKALCRALRGGGGGGESSKPE